MSESSSPNVTLRGDIPDMMEKLVIGQPLQTHERMALNCMRMVHVNTQEELFVSRSFWMLWLGLRGTPIEKAFADSWPCFGFVMASTGAAAEPASCGERCGKSRYCNHCELVLKLVGESWHLGIMTDCAIAVLQKCVVAWTASCCDMPWHAFPVAAEVHRCGPTCSYNPEQGQ